MKISFITLHVRDVDASIRFYETVLGFTVGRRFSPRPGMDIAFMGDGHGGSVEFIKDDSAGFFSGSGVSLGFRVDDIDAVRSKLAGLGVEIAYGPVRSSGGVSLLGARDCNGLELGFVQEPAGDKPALA
ncbi:MAG: VOC family protein [Spirochaetes bacterium]|nr:VOC family protein [Spirochaetota bacterium]